MAIFPTRIYSLGRLFGHVTFANIWDLKRTVKRVILVLWGAGGRGEGSDKRTRWAAWLWWPMGVPREETSGSNQFMCDRFRREIGKERTGCGEGKRVRAQERQCWEAKEGKERARVRWRGANQTVHFANSPTFWFAAMKRHYLQRSPW